MPTLRRGDIVVMDNLACHKRDQVREAIEAAGCELKALLRQAAKRTVESLWKYLGQALDEFKPAECLNYFTSGGYPTATPPREPL